MGVVAFRLGEQSDPRDEAERATEVLEPELPEQAAGTPLPARDLASETGGLRLGERWRPRRVFLAVVVDKLGNGRNRTSGRPIRTAPG
jgi:hypothetical protein